MTDTLNKLAEQGILLTKPDQFSIPLTEELHVTPATVDRLRRIKGEEITDLLADIAAISEEGGIAMMIRSPALLSLEKRPATDHVIQVLQGLEENPSLAIAAAARTVLAQLLPPEILSPEAVAVV